MVVGVTGVGARGKTYARVFQVGERCKNHCRVYQASEKIHIIFPEAG